MVRMDKGLRGRIERATQPCTQFQGTEINGRRFSDHTRHSEERSTFENCDCPSGFTWK